MNDCTGLYKEKYNTGTLRKPIIINLTFRASELKYRDVTSKKTIITLF